MIRGSERASQRATTEIPEIPNYRSRVLTSADLFHYESPYHYFVPVHQRATLGQLRNKASNLEVIVGVCRSQSGCPYTGCARLGNTWNRGRTRARQSLLL